MLPSGPRPYLPATAPRLGVEIPTCGRGWTKPQSICAPGMANWSSPSGRMLGPVLGVAGRPRRGKATSEHSRRTGRRRNAWTTPRPLSRLAPT